MKVIGEDNREKWKSEFLLRFSAKLIQKTDKKVQQQRVSCVFVLDCTCLKLRERFVPKDMLTTLLHGS